MGLVHRHTHDAYGESAHERVHVVESLLAENDRIAADNRAEFASHGVWSLNLMSSPGAGKTTLLRATLTALRDRYRVGVVEGDIETSLDADLLAPVAAAVSLVNTSKGFGGECHLDAPMVRAGLGRLDLGTLDVVIVENVGNLVCPAEFDVGEHAKAMVFAVTEGEEKPLKYPVMFRAVDVVIMNKTDLLPHLDFDVAAFTANVAKVNPSARVIPTSARTGDGVDEWIAWLEAAISSR